MSVSINMASLNAQRNQTKSQNDLSTAISRLSSGLRINSAKDDAAGLAIADRFTAQIRGTTQAGRNANDGISLAQTAEGALASIDENLQRIRELAVQAANATNSAADRASLQLEVSQLVSEIDRVANQTQFNGINMLDGSFMGKAFQAGANLGQTIVVPSIASATASALGRSSNAPQLTSLGLTPGATSLDGAGQFTINGVDVYAGSTVAWSASGIAAAINARGIAGVRATALPKRDTGTYSHTAGMTAGSASLYLNGVQIGLSLTGIGATDVANTIAAINSYSAATGTRARTGYTGDSIEIYNFDGGDINIGFAAGTATNVSAYDIGLGDVSYVNGSYQLRYTGYSPLVIGGTAGFSEKGLPNDIYTPVVSDTPLTTVDVSTVAGANAALALVDTALTTISSARASLGAVQNRFISTIENLQTAGDNSAASRGRIQDADFAVETANLARSQVLQQAGTAMLAQSNQQTSQVLSLLRSR